MLPATLGLAATQLNLLVDTLLASRLGDGPITYLQLSFRLIQLPIGLFGVAIATANLARVSRDAAHGDIEALRKNLAASLRAAALLTLPATFGLLALREPIVRLLFEHGRFDAEDTSRTATAVVCYALGLFAYSVTKIEVPTFYALGDTRTPVLASVTSVSIKILASFAFITVLRRFGVDPFLGLALSTSLAAWINFTWLGLGLRRRIGRLTGHGIFSTTLRMLALSAGMAWICSVSYEVLARRIGNEGLFREIVVLGLTIGIGIVLVVIGTQLLGIPEARQLARRLRGRVDR